MNLSGAKTHERLGVNELSPRCILTKPRNSLRGRNSDIVSGNYRLEAMSVDCTGDRHREIEAISRPGSAKQPHCYTDEIDKAKYGLRRCLTLTATPRNATFRRQDHKYQLPVTAWHTSSHRAALARRTDRVERAAVQVQTHFGQLLIWSRFRVLQGKQESI